MRNGTWMVRAIVLFAGLASAGCNRAPDSTSAPSDAASDTASATDEGSAGETSTTGDALADVTAVEVTGSDGAYTFSVTLRSPDTGCDQYADWWEVLASDGTLLYRRILAHSHVDEQPFTRSGGPVDAEASATLFVRAHMNPGGYGGVAMMGSVADGFTAMNDPQGIPATDVETQPPLPDGCAF